MRRAPPSAQELFENARVHLGEGRKGDALKFFELAIRANPKHHQSWADRGSTLHNLGNYFDAVLNFERASDIEPKNAVYHNNRGVSLIEMQRYQEALDAFGHSVQLNPVLPEPYLNIGNILRLLNQPEQALVAYDQALKMRQNYNDAILNQSLCLLSLGRLEEGWIRYEARWQSGQIFLHDVRHKDNSAVPFWNGEDLAGKKLLLYVEQGHGDGLQFCRYVNVVKDMYPTCELTLLARLPLVKLCQTLRGVDRVIVVGEEVGDFDYSLPIMSVPRVLNTSMDTIPKEVPYLFPSEDRVAYWENRLNKDLKDFKDHFRVGICWAGGERPFQAGAASIDRRRSTNLAMWGAVATVPGVIWVSLQKGNAQTQINPPPHGMTIAEFVEELDDFADTAAVMKNLDLVISVDTSVVHCAGAVNVPVWLLSRYDNCWRWLGDRSDSPWYPSLRQYIQKNAGDWMELLERVGSDLRVEVARHKQRFSVAAE